MDFKNLVILGKGWEKDKLSISSELTSLAAGALYENKGIKKITISGGKTLSGSTSEARVMKEYIQNHFLIPDKTFILEENSLGTSENAEFVYRIVKKEGFEKIGLVTVGYHLHRALRLFDNYGMKINGLASEEVVLKYKPEKKNLVEKWKNSEFAKQDEIREPYLELLLYLDPKGRIPRWFAHRTRN